MEESSVSSVSSVSSISSVSIVTICTGTQALKDLTLLLCSLERCYDENALPMVYVLTDTPTSKSMPKYKGEIRVKIGLDVYKNLNRQQMSSRPGSIYKTLFADFTAEKLVAMQWVFEETQSVEGIWFLDTDIVLLQPLPDVSVKSHDLAFCPHYMKPSDEAMYGYYNAGMFWISRQRKDLLDIWLKVMHNSKFFEQTAMEDVVKHVEKQRLYTLPIQCNFGWWRMYQATVPPQRIQKQIAINPHTKTILYQGKPLCSIHTHFLDKSQNIIGIFNRFMLAAFKSIEAKDLLETLTSVFGVQ